MALPFNRHSEPAKRPAEADPFLEFEPERSSLLKPSLPSQPSDPLPGGAPPLRLDLLSPPSAAHPAVSLQIRRRSGVGKVLAGLLLVAVVVAGLAMVALRWDSIRPAFSSFTAWATTTFLPAPRAPGAASAQAQPGTATEADPVTSVTVAPLAGPALPERTPSPTSPSGTPSVRAAGPSAPARTRAPGRITFRSPLDLQVFHQGRLVGTTGAQGVTLPAGDVDLVLVSAAHEFRQARSIQVTGGQSTALSVTLPDGRLSVNADPWAEVLIDGQSAGITPLANLPLRIGSHEVVWRHPSLGERRQVVLVRAKTPTRVGVDFRR